MYTYNETDQQLVNERVAQFEGQTQRFLAGELTEDEFRTLRLQNGLYIQRHAPMLRVAIPYGLLRADQLRKLADIARRYDRGYGHFSTRQNMQFNWPRLEDVPAILGELATVQLHAIQTSGNCIRNTTSDHLAGVAPDEIVNPLVWCEIIRQWSTFHPEFAFLPRKFKIAVSGATTDRAAIAVNDIGLQAVTQNGETGFQVWAGGGLGRTPIVGKQISPFVPWPHLLTYLSAILRVYNLHGRRDNKYKARIKILVRDMTPEGFAKAVDEHWQALKNGPDTLTQAHVDQIASRFNWPVYQAFEAGHDSQVTELKANNPAFARWLRTNTHAHKVAGYAAVSVSLKPTGSPPGDITADQMDSIATLAEQYSQGQLRVTHEQNLLLPAVPRQDLPALWHALNALGLATPNIGLLTNIISCPGGDFCALANAVSIPVAAAIQARFDDLDYLHDIGELDLNISGCINACGHHHVGHIGILGVDKAGQEWYQVTLGGRQSAARTEQVGDTGAEIGRIIGPSFSREQIPDVIERLIQTYLGLRDDDTERFIDVIDRVGPEPFKTAVYSDPNIVTGKIQHTRNEEDAHA
ncbi:sulfite reductase [Pusillimonas sp. T2]|uniref:nitrite/sulfite reductase n=1 Tax=Pusillimonas sp. T2 TaxID=1548123 RepID=UPI000B9D45C4|nr:nitrite/sulfite reductase [Pusillimonas sp. T2]OXR50518.1 sulfite reductase [Pusillimonas sp. T2]